MGLIIAIDGPAGSGKSTVAREVARKLRLSYVDTGAIYRSLAYEALQKQLREDDEEGIAELAKKLPLRIVTSPEGQKFFLEDIDISEVIRSEKVSRLASVMSRHKKVREQLLDLQRKLGSNAEQGAVLEGRDIGTVVFPDAQLKFFLTASNEERARRRCEELIARGEQASFERVLQEIMERDERDSKRDIAPMVPAQDARIVDTTFLPLGAVIDFIVGVVSEHNQSR